MKQVRKILSLLLALVMILGLATTALAAADSTYKISINNKLTGHTYKAYQVFKGEYTGTDDQKFLTNIEWGSGVDGAGLLAELKTNTTEFGTKYASCTTAEDVAEVLRVSTDNSADAFKFAKAVAKHLSSTVAATATAPTNEKYELSVKGDGYYIVMDDAQISGNDAATGYLLKVVGQDEEINVKESVPTVTKKVDEVNDTTVAGSRPMEDIASYDIGDNIKYTLTAKLDNALALYKTYKLVFHDTLSKGLTFVSNDTNFPVTVIAKTVDITDHFTVTPSTDAATGVTKLDISCDDILSITKKDSIEKLGLEAGDSIVVTYYAKLNESAVIGKGTDPTAVGNPNTVALEFSNDPYHETYTGTTPGDTVTVLTYQVVINKKDSNGTDALAGAAFKLEKGTLDGTGGYAYTTIKDYATNFDKDQTQFVFTGLDAGRYRLTETKTPAGYNTIDPIEFNITETLDAANPANTTIAGAGINESFHLTFANKNENGIPDNFSLSLDIINEQGSKLPSTGGIGTTIFYVVGAILVLGAGILLITKKRSARR